MTGYRRGVNLMEMNVFTRYDFMCIVHFDPENI